MAQANWVTSPSGIKYNVRFDPQTYSEVFARNGNEITGKVVTAWDDAGDLKADLMESTEWVAGQKWLKRTLPLRHPESKRLYLSKLTKAEVFFDNGDGGYAVQTRDAATGFWAMDRIAYHASFVNLPYDLKEDQDVQSLVNPEMNRYCTVAPQPVCSNRTIQSTGWVLDALVDGKTQGVSEAASVPEILIRFTIKLWQWPKAAIPWAAIIDRAGKLNDASFTVGGVTHPAESLLYEGLAGSPEEYTGPDSERYVDLTHSVLRHPVNWNKVFFGGTYQYFKQRDSVPPQRRYQLASFPEIFNPA